VPSDIEPDIPAPIVDASVNGDEPHTQSVDFVAQSPNDRPAQLPDQNQDQVAEQGPSKRRQKKHQG
jgi:hypothetical protein